MQDTKADATSGFYELSSTLALADIPSQENYDI